MSGPKLSTGEKFFSKFVTIKILAEELVRNQKLLTHDTLYTWAKIKKVQREATRLREKTERSLERYD